MKELKYIGVQNYLPIRFGTALKIYPTPTSVSDLFRYLVTLQTRTKFDKNSLYPTLFLFVVFNHLILNIFV